MFSDVSVQDARLKTRDPKEKLGPLRLTALLANIWRQPKAFELKTFRYLNPGKGAYQSNAPTVSEVPSFVFRVQYEKSGRKTSRLKTFD